tara:strand:+ start:1207 stop:1380 length:174 start_codon:yes stop_codon:yes gene_type:complete
MADLGHIGGDLLKARNQLKKVKKVEDRSSPMLHGYLTDAQVLEYQSEQVREALEYAV